MNETTYDPRLSRGDMLRPHLILSGSADIFITFHEESSATIKEYFGFVSIASIFWRNTFTMRPRTAPYDQKEMNGQRGSAILHTTSRTGGGLTIRYFPSESCRLTSRYFPSDSCRLRTSSSISSCPQGQHIPREKPPAPPSTGRPNY